MTGPFFNLISIANKQRISKAGLLTITRQEDIGQECLNVNVIRLVLTKPENQENHE